jgi:hypothetical protein
VKYGLLSKLDTRIIRNLERSTQPGTFKINDKYDIPNIPDPTIQPSHPAFASALACVWAPPSPHMMASAPKSSPRYVFPLPRPIFLKISVTEMTCRLLGGIGRHQYDLPCISVIPLYLRHLEQRFECPYLTRPFSANGRPLQEIAVSRSVLAPGLPVDEYLRHLSSTTVFTPVPAVVSLINLTHNPRRDLLVQTLCSLFNNSISGHNFFYNLE